MTDYTEFDEGWHAVNWWDDGPKWRAFRVVACCHGYDADGDVVSEEVETDAYVLRSAFNEQDLLRGRVIKQAVLEALAEIDTDELPSRTLYCDWAGGVDLPYSLTNHGGVEER